MCRGRRTWGAGVARVELASLSLGWVTDNAGNAQSGVTATITSPSGPATVYAAATGVTTTTPTSDANGYLRGFVEEGVYTLTISGNSHTVDVVSGTAIT